MKQIITDLFQDAFNSAFDSGEYHPNIERPKDASHGDWACVDALRLAKALSKNPREIAEGIVDNFAQSEYVEKIEIAGPGFINVTLSNLAHQKTFFDVVGQGEQYAKSDLGKGKKVDIEFVSANPTGPMHIGHGRWASLGDSLARVMDFCGFDVTREFYINDAGNQMNIFAISVMYRYMQIQSLVNDGKTLDEAIEYIYQNSQKYREELPKDCYGGLYVVDIAGIFYKEGNVINIDLNNDDQITDFRQKSYEIVLNKIKTVLSNFGLEFDVWFSETNLYKKDTNDKNAIDLTIDEIDSRGLIYINDNAKFFKTTEFGDDKDRVLVKSDGAYTYFAPDIAYHKNKFDRGFDRCIDILGADHHGYVKRIQSVGAVFDHPGQPEVIIGQLVNLLRDGQPVRMSKRTGEMVTFEELVEEVGVDATRFLMLMNSTDQAIDCDIEKAKLQDSSNPVYYVQYAHARICSMLNKCEQEGITVDFDNLQLASLASLQHESELELAKIISEFSEIVESCARDMAPFRLTHYAQTLAQKFHKFYTDCHIIGEKAELAQARMVVAKATQIVLKSCLSLLGVSAPNKM
ncbi:MAG: arginine--tRNA ligase [Coriobacteriales bacterium]|nr:arginine--tRNA ligase [Coriobacteriales bacterium]